MLRVALFLLLLVPLATRSAESLHLAAASDLVYCLEALNAEFSREAPHIAVNTTTGSSGNFYAQIKHGAPYDLFLSADFHYPKELISAGLAPADSLTFYAIGRIVLWTTRPGLDLDRGLALVQDPAISRFAIANPEHAPYGRAAKEALETHQLWSAAKPKLVLGENISQTAQFVQTGNADAGIVALSLVLSPRLSGVGRHVEIPATDHTPLEQAAVLTNRGATNPAARRYLEFLRSPAARKIFDAYGFHLPPPPAG